MGSTHRIATPAEGPTGDVAPGLVWGDVEVPGWEEFTDARERFLARLEAQSRARRAEGDAATAVGAGAS